MKNVSVCVLGVLVLVDGFCAGTTVSFIRYSEFPRADVVGIELYIESNLCIEVEEGVDVVTLLAGTRCPANKLLAVNIFRHPEGLFGQLFSEVNLVPVRNTLSTLFGIDRNRILRWSPLSVERYRVCGHPRTEVERFAFTVLVVIPAGKLVAFWPSRARLIIRIVSKRGLILDCLRVSSGASVDKH